jgi:hypothetical protein
MFNNSLCCLLSFYEQKLPFVSMLIKGKPPLIIIRLYRTLDGTTNPKLLHFLTTIIFLLREEGACF